jgi:hypothetical protein
LPYCEINYDKILTIFLANTFLDVYMRKLQIFISRRVRLESPSLFTEELELNNLIEGVKFKMLLQPYRMQMWPKNRYQGDEWVGKLSWILAGILLKITR